MSEPDRFALPALSAAAPDGLEPAAWHPPASPPAPKRAALARGRRMDRITDRNQRAALQSLDDLWRDFRVTEVDEVVIRRAAELADRHALRGYDAVHCASAERIADADLVVASGDKELLAACSELALATALTGQ